MPFLTVPPSRTSALDMCAGCCADHRRPRYLPAHCQHSWWRMKRCRYIAIEAFVMLTFTVGALAFHTAVRVASPGGSTQLANRNGLYSSRRSISGVSSGYDVNARRNIGRHGDGTKMMARSNRLKSVIARQRNLDKANAPVILSDKARRKAQRERRAYFRDRYAVSGRRLIKLQEEDPDSFYIGFVGTNSAGRAQALVAVEAYLRRATELKVAKHHKGNADIKLVDAGNMCLSEMRGKDEQKLALLRRCDLLVHVVRCFDLSEPAPYKRWRVERKEQGNQEGGDEQEAAEDAPERPSLSNLGGGLRDWGGGDGEEVEEKIDWPLSPTPLEDVRATRAEMAYADLQFIEERQKANHTRWFWRDRGRALNERSALAAVVPVLEDAYAVGGELEPVGVGFRKSCLSDEPGVNGTTLYRSRKRAAIKEIGLLTPKPVVYVANVPSEAAPSSDSDDVDDDDGEPKQASESAEAISKVALAHADKVVGIERDYGVPAVVGCLRNPEGRIALGAAVFKAIPQKFLSRDPKLRKAANSASSKAQDRTQQRRRRPDARADRASAAEPISV